MKKLVLKGGVAVASLLTLAACTSGGSSSHTSPQGGSSASNPQSGGASTSHTAASPTPVQIKFQAANGQSPVTPITVNASDGILTAVNLSRGSVQVKGKMSANGKSWTSSEVLGFAHTYKITATAKGAAGPVTKSLSFSTVKPSKELTPFLNDEYGSSIQNGAKYGVAFVPVVHFNKPVPTNEQAVITKSLVVTTTPSVTGAWYWADSQNVHWRAKSYYTPGTKFSLSAALYGRKFASGIYGGDNAQVSYSIGRRQLTEAYDNAPHGVDKVKVLNGAGKVLRTMDTSMGQHKGVQSTGGYINFYTLNGAYTVLGHENPAIMNSTSYGLSVADGGYGNITVPYSTKITTDGIYLHEYNSTQYEQTHGIDASEGCLNLVTADAKWFYDHSIVGDPVIVHGAKGAPDIQLWQGGDWQMSWAKWLAGSTK